jgi:hypothetical protein
MEQGREADRRFEKFKADFGNVMSQMARNLADKMGGSIVQGMKHTHNPQTVTP